MINKVIKKFIDSYKDENVETRYPAGAVCEDEQGLNVGFESCGAAETFSVGQPVYDADGNLMGYLGIDLYDALDYSSDGIRIPVERWKICLPTKYCIEGKRIYTYWQNKQRMEERLRGQG